MLHGAGIFTNICPENHPNVGKYTIHGESEKHMSWMIHIGPIRWFGKTIFQKWHEIVRIGPT